MVSPMLLSDRRILCDPCSVNSELRLTTRCRRVTKDGDTLVLRREALDVIRWFGILWSPVT